MKCSTVEITRQEVSEFDRSRKIISINRDDIDQIDLRYGVIGERILINIFVGIVLIVIGTIIGIFPLVPMFAYEYNPENFHGMKTFALAAPLIFVGVYHVGKLFSRRYYLLIRVGKRYRKIIFKDKIDDTAIHEYLNRANRLFGYDIQIND